MKDDITLNQAYKIAEKVDRLRTRVNNNFKIDNLSKPSLSSRISTSNHANIKTYNKNNIKCSQKQIINNNKRLTLQYKTQKLYNTFFLSFSFIKYSLLLKLKITLKKNVIN